MHVCECVCMHVCECMHMERQDSSLHVHCIMPIILQHESPYSTMQAVTSLVPRPPLAALVHNCGKMPRFFPTVSGYESRQRNSSYFSGVFEVSLSHYSHAALSSGSACPTQSGRGRSRPFQTYF